MRHTQRRALKPQEAELRRLARIKDVLRLIRNHYHEEISLDDMATSAHMNKRYFCRYFREMMGKTPIQYLNYYRVECACELLSTSERTVSEVAMACGFNNISYFVRVFGAHKGTTPSIYAKAYAAILSKEGDCYEIYGRFLAQQTRVRALQLRAGAGRAVGRRRVRRVLLVNPRHRTGARP